MIQQHKLFWPDFRKWFPKPHTLELQQVSDIHGFVNCVHCNHSKGNENEKVASIGPALAKIAIHIRIIASSIHLRSLVLQRNILAFRQPMEYKSHFLLQFIQWLDAIDSCHNLHRTRNPM